MAKFGLIGLGYISNRHILAMENLGHELKVVLDPSRETILFNHENLWVLNNEENFFEECLDYGVEWVSICSPTIFHFDQIIACLQSGFNVIVEKPICLSVKELNEIQREEKKSGKKVFTIFQLRYHSLVENFQLQEKNHEVFIFYRGNRNKDYFASWKGDMSQSGGIISAVGLHYFDLLSHYFGNFTGKMNIEESDFSKSKGFLRLKSADVHWDFAFIDEEAQMISTQRSFKINGKEFDFSNYDEYLHETAYRAIANGEGVDTDEAKKSLVILEAIAQT